MAQIILYSIAFIGFLLFVVFGPIIFAFKHNRYFQKRAPQALGYRWGYFVAYASIMQFVFIIVYYLVIEYGMDALNATGETPVKARDFIKAMVDASVGFYIMKRERWAWIVAIVGTIFIDIAPVLLVPNISLVEEGLALLFLLIPVVYSSFYLKNRWEELKEGPSEFK